MVKITLEKKGLQPCVCDGFHGKSAAIGFHFQTAPPSVQPRGLNAVMNVYLKAHSGHQLIFYSYSGYVLDFMTGRLSNN